MGVSATCPLSGGRLPSVSTTTPTRRACASGTYEPHRRYNLGNIDRDGNPQTDELMDLE